MGDVIAGHEGNALHFDGSGDALVMDHDAELDPRLSDFSVSTWMHSTQGGVPILLDYRLSGGHGWVLFTYGGRLGFQMRWGPARRTGTTTSATPT